MYGKKQSIENRIAHSKRMSGRKQTDETVVCSLDKDLLMIPGVHFNWNKLEYTHVDQFTGLRTFYKQMLIGDRSDNIFGVDKIGPVKAAKLIDHLTNEQEMLETVFELYNQDEERFIMNAQCLWIMQNKDETWAHRTLHELDLPNQLLLGMERELEFMKSLTDDISMEQSTMKPLMSGSPANGMEKDTTLTNPVDQI